MSTTSTASTDFDGVRPVKLAPDVEPGAPEPTFTERCAPERARALRFLATHTAALTNAYAIRINVAGVVTLQGELGALQSLVEMWGAQRHDDLSNGFHEWGGAVGDPAVNVVLVEEAAR